MKQCRRNLAYPLLAATLMHQAHQILLSLLKQRRVQVALAGAVSTK